ncbi:hypothetical protein BS78_10G099600 [Paspalum vaginatum]|nr:hypothetical protein BS78_10G099600 [Paspalum vaginatum]
MVPDIDILGTWRDIKDTDEISVVSLVVCSRHLIAAIVAVRGYCSIAMCRIGAATWSVSAYDQCRQLSIRSSSKGSSTPLTTRILLPLTLLVRMTARGQGVSRIERLIKWISLPIQEHYIWMEHYYLLESHGSLLMISRKVSYKRDSSILVAGSSKFKVFKANFESLSSTCGLR